MLYAIKPGCFRPRLDGTSNIHIQYCYDNVHKTLLDTGLVIHVDFWDKNNSTILPDLPIEYGRPAILNESLLKQMRLVEDVIAYATKKNIENKGAFVKQFYTPDLDIYSLDELVRKAEHEKVEEEKKIQDAIRAHLKDGTERDEYPYASTIEGGDQAVVAYVPKHEQRVQGGDLSKIYSTILFMDSFIVFPVPEGKEPNPESVPILPPILRPVPMPVPEHRPSLREKIALATGLSGFALTAYLIISEGSRIIPARNIIPIP